MGNLALGLRGTTLSWTIPVASNTPGTLRVVDAHGREIARNAVAAGIRAGSVEVSGQGLMIAILESAQGSASAVVPSLR